MLVLPSPRNDTGHFIVDFIFSRSGPIVVAHVGVHVGDEDVQAAVVVEVEHLDAHRAPRRPREHLTALPDEALAAGVLVVLVVALHVQHVQIEPAVVVDVDRARVARPGEVDEARPLRDVDEAVAALVAIQNASLGPRRLQVAGEGVLERRRSTCSRRRQSCSSYTVRR